MKRRKKPPTIPIGTSGSGLFKRRVEILVSDAKTHFHILGTSGCLHPDTPIFDPVDKTTRSVYQRYLAAQPFHVVSINERNEPVIARAQPPQQFTKERMYRVTLSTGESFTVTGKHRVFVGNGYREVCDLARQIDDAAVLPIPLPSIAGSDLFASLADAQRWKQTDVNFQDDSITGFAHVMSIEKVEAEFYYDFHVPTYENYWACGVFHHNSGKSRLLASLYLSLIKNGLAATLIDPHGDLAKLVLAQLASDGYFSRPDAFEKLIYLDLPTGEEKGLYVPFNVLKQPLPPHTVASNIKESMHRAWPALAGGSAPMFDTLVQDGCKVLITNHLPLTSLYRLLTDKAFRDSLLEHEQDPDIIAFFHDQFDRLSLRDQADQAGSALRRAHLLTFSPILKYSLGQTENRLNFREIIDRDQSVIINLALTDSEARRLLGCLLTVSAEHGSLSRASLPYEERENSHHLFIDEFSEFSAQSEEALARMLSLTRKYGLFLVMAHQTWSQASERLRGALQNVGVEVAFRLGRSDAQHTAMIMGRVDPETVKHVVEQGEERSHPLFYSLPEQWERLTQELQDQPPRHFMFKTAQGQTIRGKTLDMKNPVVDPNLLKRIEDEYLSRYFVPQETVVAEKEKSQEPAEKVIFRKNKL